MTQKRGGGGKVEKVKVKPTKVVDQPIERVKDIPHSGCVIMRCDCVSAYQDARLGKGRRTHNVLGGKREGARCTVCEREKTF